jgi:H+/Cl- antiporter ClcA
MAADLPRAVLGATLAVTDEAMSKSSEEKSEFRPRDRWLMFSFVLGPMAVLTNLLVSYSLVPTACTQRSKAMLHVSTLVFVVLSLIGGAIAWHYYKECDLADGVLWRERTRWVATVAMVLALASVVVILAMEIPNLMLGSCD